jgi:hypothetical protein
MKKKYIQLLQTKINKLENPDFDLEAWKTSVITTLIHVLGHQDARIKLINELKIDYSSWALRDATAGYNPEATCKKQGREILESIIEEIELFGPSNQQSNPVENITDTNLVKSIDSKNWVAVTAVLKKMKKEELVNVVMSLVKAP